MDAAPHAAPDSSALVDARRPVPHRVERLAKVPPGKDWAKRFRRQALILDADGRRSIIPAFLILISPRACRGYT